MQNPEFDNKKKKTNTSRLNKKKIEKPILAKRILVSVKKTPYRLIIVEPLSTFKLPKTLSSIVSECKANRHFPFEISYISSHYYDLSTTRANKGTRLMRALFMIDFYLQDRVPQRM